MNIAEVCIKKPTVTISLAAAMLLAGVIGYFNLGRLEDPEFTIKNAQIVTLYPGATAEEVANEVTDPLETAVQQMGQPGGLPSMGSHRVGHRLYFGGLQNHCRW